MVRDNHLFSMIVSNMDYIEWSRYCPCFCPEKGNSLRKNIRSRHNSKVIIINLKKNTIIGKMVLDCQGTSFTFILCWCHTWNSRASHQCQDWRLYLMKWIQHRILSLAFLCQKKEKMHNQKEKTIIITFKTC